MSYANITEDLSHVIRDASLEETRFLFEDTLRDDPGQPWASRGPYVVRDEPILEEVMSDLC